MNADAGLLELLTIGMVFLIALPGYLCFWGIQKRKQFRLEIQKQCEMLKMMLDSQKTLENMIDLCREKVENPSQEEENAELLKKMRDARQTPFSILFNGKLEECRRQQIAVELERDVERDELLSSVDMISLFGNILDNAMEACMSLDVAERRVKIILRQKMNLLYLEVINTKKKSLVLARTKMSTTKSDAMLHGYGVSIIKEIVKKHHGEMFVKDKGEEFYLRVMLTL